MSIFGMFGKLTKAAIHTALLPVDVAVDVVTMGRALDGDEPATLERLKQIVEDIEEAAEEAGDDY